MNLPVSTLRRICEKVIAVNVDNQENKEKERGRGVMIEKDGSMFVVYDSGKQEPLLIE